MPSLLCHPERAREPAARSLARSPPRRGPSSTSCHPEAGKRCCCALAAALRKKAARRRPRQGHRVLPRDAPSTGAGPASTPSCAVQRSLHRFTAVQPGAKRGDGDSTASPSRPLTGERDVRDPVTAGPRAGQRAQPRRASLGASNLTASAIAPELQPPPPP